MIEYLKELLQDLKECKNEIICLNLKQKIFALETAIEILEKLRNEERSIQNGNIK